MGPLAFFHTPMISIGMGSGCVPWNTVQAVACMPGLMSFRGKIATLPAFGGAISAALRKTGAKLHAASAAKTELHFMGGTTLHYH